MTEGVKYDDGKPATELLSAQALLGLSRVLRYGEAKYAAHNWRGGMAWGRLIGAALRHLLAFLDGEDTDAESGLPHIDHAACCIMFLSEYQKRALGTDDRWREGALRATLCSTCNETLYTTTELERAQCDACWVRECT